MIEESKIKHETITGCYWVLEVGSGYEVYERGITHSVRVGQLSPKSPEALSRAIIEAERRESIRVNGEAERRESIKAAWRDLVINYHNK